MKQMIPLLKQVNFPSYFALSLLLIAMGIDLVTGVIKATRLRRARTSSGLRKSVNKFIQYGGAISISIILSAVAVAQGMPRATAAIGLFGDGIVYFISYIEITSILENLVALDPGSKVSKLIFRPLLSLLTFQLKNNPSVRAIIEETKIAKEEDETRSTNRDGSDRLS